MTIQQLNIHSVLVREFGKRRARNGTYSLRAFSKFLGVSPGGLSEILNGKRNVSKQLVGQFAERLGLDPLERRQLMTPPIAAVTFEAEDIQFLEMEQFHLISDWYHYAILNLLDVKDFMPSSTSIAARLGITRSQADDAWNRLIRLGLVKEEDGCWRASGKFISSTHEIKSTALKKFHSQLLEKATESLLKDELDIRDITSVSMAIDPSQIPLAKSEITKFRRHMAQLLETGTQSQVYNLSVQLFPLERGV